MRFTLILTALFAGTLLGGCAHSRSERQFASAPGRESVAPYPPGPKPRPVRVLVQTLVPIGERLAVALLERELKIQARPGEPEEHILYRVLLDAGVHGTRKMVFPDREASPGGGY